MSSILFGGPCNHKYVICVYIHISCVPSNHRGLIDAMRPQCLTLKSKHKTDAWLDGILNHEVITAKIKVQCL